MTRRLDPIAAATIRKLREENERLREIIAAQAETIRRYQQDARARIARSGE